MRRGFSICVVLAAMAACGGGKSDGDVGTSDGSSQPPPAEAEKPASRAEAARFLTQATFGPTDAEVDHVMSVGYSAWIDEQFAKPASTNRPLWDAADAAAKAVNASNNAGQDGMTNAFWRNAISGGPLPSRYASEPAISIVARASERTTPAR